MTKNQKITIGAVLVVSAGALIYSLATYKGHSAPKIEEPVASGPTLNEMVINEQNAPSTPVTGVTTPATTTGGTATGSTVSMGPVTGGQQGVPPSASATSTLAGVPGATPGTPATPVETAVAEAKPASYTVKKGDTLHSIAKRELGSETKWKDLLAANPSLDPKKLKIGMSLQLPAAKAPAVASGSTGVGNGSAPVVTPGTPSLTGTGTSGFTPVANTTAAPKPAKTTASAPKTATTSAPVKVSVRDGVQIYTVRNGDTLRSISKDVYRGDEQKWESVFKLNRDVIGSDPGRLEPGTILILPASGK